MSSVGSPASSDKFKCLIELGDNKYQLILSKKDVNIDTVERALPTLAVHVPALVSVSSKTHKFELFDADFAEYITLCDKQTAIPNLAKIRILPKESTKKNKWTQWKLEDFAGSHERTNENAACGLVQASSTVNKDVGKSLPATDHNKTIQKKIKVNLHFVKVISKHMGSFITNKFDPKNWEMVSNEMIQYKNDSSLTLLKLKDATIKTFDPEFCKIYFNSICSNYIGYLEKKFHLPYMIPVFKKMDKMDLYPFLNPNTYQKVLVLRGSSSAKVGGCNFQLKNSIGNSNLSLNKLNETKSSSSSTVKLNGPTSLDQTIVEFIKKGNEKSKLSASCSSLLVERKCFLPSSDDSLEEDKYLLFLQILQTHVNTFGLDISEISWSLVSEDMMLSGFTDFDSEKCKDLVFRLSEAYLSHLKVLVENDQMNEAQLFSKESSLKIFKMMHQMDLEPFLDQTFFKQLTEMKQKFASKSSTNSSLRNSRPCSPNASGWIPNLKDKVALPPPFKQSAPSTPVKNLNSGEEADAVEEVNDKSVQKVDMELSNLTVDQVFIDCIKFYNSQLCDFNCDSDTLWSLVAKKMKSKDCEVSADFCKQRFTNFTNELIIALQFAETATDAQRMFPHFDDFAELNLRKFIKFENQQKIERLMKESVKIDEEKADTEVKSGDD